MTIQRAKITPDLIAKRREAVARLRVRQLSARKIAEALPKMNPPILKPNGEAYKKSVIINDIHALREEWVESASIDTMTYASEMLAELVEVKAVAWARVIEGKPSPDLKTILCANDRIAKLLGLNAPDRVDLCGTLQTIPFSEEAAQKLLERFRSQPPDPVIDITAHANRLSLGVTLSDEPKNGNGKGGNGGGNNGN